MSLGLHVLCSGWLYSSSACAVNSYELACSQYWLKDQLCSQAILGFSFFANWRCEWPGKEAKWELVCKELVERIIHTAPFQCGTTLAEH